MLVTGYGVLHLLPALRPPGEAATVLSGELTGWGTLEQRVLAACTQPCGYSPLDSSQGIDQFCPFLSIAWQTSILGPLGPAKSSSQGQATMSGGM